MNRFAIRGTRSVQPDPAVQGPVPARPPAPGRAASGPVANTAHDIPYGVRIAAAWAWRVGLIIAVSGIIVWLLSQVSLLVIPVMIAALLSGLLSPVVVALRRWHVPNGLATGLTIVAFLGLIGGALSIVGRTLASGFASLWTQALAGIVQVETWLSQGPLQLTNAEINQYLDSALKQLQGNSSSILSGALSWGTTVGHLAAGLLLTLFALIFFLLEGNRIWGFLVGLMPRTARAATDGAGRRGWSSLVNYVRVQLFVAFIDAVGIGMGAFILGVPLALPLSVLVFLGSFIPILGALFTGAIAVLLALVANGWVNALIMLAIVLVVQQAESHILQPLIMGKAVSLHPLAVVLAVAGGSMVAGIPGALFAVPAMAILNTVVRYIAARSWEAEPAPSPGPPPSESGEAPADLDGEASRPAATAP
ncbi:AI-2E family transporter [Zafaria cholistanensis]|uniref:AI-2E family transporter n=1 Tax=Zafaria cholistanensis TaxID=1682741 RepID=A0A5A7NSN6_9MICC|nr:AI-2E family transporter [Zafaria cholistanensis]GER23865.1 AI-2E family transporter [Zafaria cholistanensis]